MTMEGTRVKQAWFEAVIDAILKGRIRKSAGTLSGSGILKGFG